MMTEIVSQFAESYMRWLNKLYRALCLARRQHPYRRCRTAFSSGAEEIDSLFSGYECQQSVDFLQGDIVERVVRRQLTHYEFCKANHRRSHFSREWPATSTSL